MPNRIDALRDFVRLGGGLLMVGGCMTFSGIEAKARRGRTALAEVLPVGLLDRDDRLELPQGPSATVVLEHPTTADLPTTWPPLLGIDEVVPLERSSVLAEIEGHPLLVIGGSGEGRTAAFTSDLAPHWATPGFLEWRGYAAIFSHTVQWLTGDAA